MKSMSALFFLGNVVAALATSLCIADDAVVISDINRSGMGSYPGGFMQLSPSRVLFSATTAELGKEPWVTDGSREGTHLLKDLVPGAGGAVGITFIKFGERALIQTFPSSTTAALWVTDGTSDGTTLLASWYSGTTVSVGYRFQINGRALFRATINNVTGLYSTDGTSAAPVLLITEAGYIDPNSTVEFAGKLYFACTGTNGAGHELWCTDGTAPGTSMVADIYPGTAGSSPQCTVIGSRLVIVARNAGGCGLWSMDGVASGVQALVGLDTGSSYCPSSFPLAKLGSKLYFATSTPTTGKELWSTDGTPEGTQPVLDIYPGATGSSPSDLYAHEGKLYFLGANEAGMHGLFAYHPDTGDLVRALWNTGSNLGVLVPLQGFPGGVAFFLSASSSDQRTLWRSDGTIAGTRAVAALSSSASFSRRLGSGFLMQNGSQLLFTDMVSPTPSLLGPYGDLYLCGATETRVFYRRYTAPKLIVTDGTAAGTVPILPSPSGCTSISFESNPVVDPAGRMLFSGEGIQGYELWETDGTAQGTRLIRDLELRTSGASLNVPGVVLNGQFYLWLYENGYLALGTSRGTPETTHVAVRPAEIDPNFNVVSSRVVTGGRLWFHTSRYEPYIPPVGYTTRLYSTDGTQAGTRREFEVAKPINLLVGVGDEVWFVVNQSSSSSPDLLYRAGGTLVAPQAITSVAPRQVLQLVAMQGGAIMELYGTGGYSIWFSDGSAAGTVELLGPQSQSRRTQLLSAGSVMYFTRETTSRRQLWRSDGTAVGTSMIGEYSQNGNFVHVGALDQDDILFMTYSPELNGYRLFRTVDGGASVLSLAAMTINDSSCTSCTLTGEFNGVWYFSATAGSNNIELWRSDGTVAGTYRFADLRPGTASSLPKGFHRTRDALFFWADTTDGKRDLWKIDGTPAVAVRVSSLPRISSATEPIVLGETDDGLFFTADNEMLGRELYVLRPGSPDCNGNLIHDRLDIALELSVDVDQNDRPDACCLADFNADRSVSIDDLFLFLNAWFAGSPTSNANADPTITVDDLFLYFNRWFTGC